MHYIELEGLNVAGYLCDGSGTAIEYKDGDSACHEALSIHYALKKGDLKGIDTVSVVKPLGDDEFEIVERYHTSEDY